VESYVRNRWRRQPDAPVNQLIYDALLLLQHRGQDAAGIVTQQERKFFMHKAKGMVRDVFRTRNMRALPGNCGLGQVRYPTAGNAFSEEEAQPFYVNAPFGIVLVHNGNLTNAQRTEGRAVQSSTTATSTPRATPRCCSTCWPTRSNAPPAACRCSRRTCLPPWRNVHQRIKGSYAVICLIAGHGVLAFRDPVRHSPAVHRAQRADGTDDGGQRIGGAGGHQPPVRARRGSRARPCSSTCTGQLHSQQCAEQPTLKPCIFEFVYLARPDSVMDGIRCTRRA